jgi:hypothetical protein
MEDNTFVDVSFNSLAYINDPEDNKVKISECGNFHCSGPRNVLIHFVGNTGFKVADGTDYTSNFSVVSNNPAFIFMAGCTLNINMNAVFC